MNLRAYAEVTVAKGQPRPAAMPGHNCMPEDEHHLGRAESNASDVDNSRNGEARDRSGQAESAKFFYRWGRLLSSTLIRLRSKFDGDFDQYLIFMVFVLSELSRSLRLAQQPSASATTPLGLNTLSVADITEIPRETVRRKLRLLVECGYLKRGDDQLYYLGDRYDPDEFLMDLAPLFNDLLNN